MSFHKPALCIAFSLIAAGCGGGGGAVSTVNPIPVAIPSPTATPAGQTTSAQSEFTVQANPTSVPMPAIPGYNGTLDLPGITGYGSVTMTVAVASAPVNNFTRRRNTGSISVNLPILVVTLVPQNAITLLGVPGFTVSVPQGINLAGENFYSGYQQSGTWYIGTGPGRLTGDTISIAQSSSDYPLELAAGSTTQFVIAGTGAATLSILSSQELAIGQPATATVNVREFDGMGNSILGRYHQPMSILSSDTSGHTMLSKRSLSSDSDSLQITYDGHGDSFSLSAFEGSAGAAKAFVTALGMENQTSSVGRMIAGSDGNIWMQSGNGVAKINSAGALTQFSDPNTTYHVHDNDAIAEDAAGNIWVDYSDVEYTRSGLDRFTHDGQLTNFPFSSNAMNGVTAMVRGPDGDVWFGSGVGIYRVDSSGNISLIANLNAPATNMVNGPDGNVWFSAGHTVDRLTNGGTLTAFTLPQASAGGLSNLTFGVGPDGNFWAPFAYRSLTLLKFSTSGTVVSDTPLAYSAPWGPSYLTSNPDPFPGTSNIVTDRFGNLYFPDTNTQGVFRFAPDGTESSYCTYTGCTNVDQGDPINLVIGSDGKLYVNDDMAPPSGSGLMVPAISVVDPTLW